jgi:hypothetical protein
MPSHESLAYSPVRLERVRSHFAPSGFKPPGGNRDRHAASPTGERGRKP